MQAQGWGVIVLAAGLLLAAAPAAPPSITINLGTRSGCISPVTKHFARADGATIDVNLPAPNVLQANLGGSVAANAYLGHTGVASEVFHLVQEFEITCSDPSVKVVSLTLESTLMGFVRSKFHGSAHLHVANALVTPQSYSASPLSVAYPPMSVAGTDGELCNQKLEALTVDALPLGKYVLTADLAIEAQAGGLCDAHAAADFTSGGALPAEFVRLRDPFQNADKKNFGFSIILTAAPAGGESTARSSNNGQSTRTASIPRAATRAAATRRNPMLRTAQGVRFSPETIR